MHDDSYTTPVVTVDHPAGPQLTANIKVDTYTQDPAPKMEVSVTSDGVMTVVFKDDLSQHYFAESQGDNKQLINGTNWTYQCDIGNNSTKTYYFYTSETSAYTTVKVFQKKGYSLSQGPVESTPSSSSTYVLNVTFTDPSGAYSYSKTDGGSRTSIAGSTLTLDCAGITYNGANTSTLYFYQTNSAGVLSNKTTVTITRNSSTNYYCGAPVVGDAYTSQTGGELISSEQSTMAVWTSGRIDDGSFYTYWFGPGNDTGDGWGSKQNGQYGYVGDGIAPFTERRETYGLTFEPVAIKRYDSRYSPEWNNDPALPIRCIREYDNSSTVTVAE